MFKKAVVNRQPSFLISRFLKKLMMTAKLDF
jgi:hypothetical protein